MEACVRLRSSLAVLLCLVSSIFAANVSSPAGPCTIVIGSGLSETQFLELSCAATALDPDAVLLLDSAPLRAGLESFLKLYRSPRLLWVGQAGPETESIRRS